MFDIFKDLADHKKEMTDDDLVSIVLEKKISNEQYYELINIQIQGSENQEHTATVTLSDLTMKPLKK